MFHQQIVRGMLIVATSSKKFERKKVRAIALADRLEAQARILRAERRATSLQTPRRHITHRKRKYGTSGKGSRFGWEL